jgi:hypothetical protein
VRHGVRPATSVFSVLPAQLDTLALSLPAILIIVAGHLKRCHVRFQKFWTQNSTRFFFVPVDFADAGMRGGGRALSDG